MTASGNNHIAVAQLGDAVLFRVVGLGNMSATPAIAALAERILSEKTHKFAFDLSACSGVDSTFMGTLVAIAMQSKSRYPSAWVCVVNASIKVSQALENVGAARFLRFKTSLPLEDIEMEQLDVTVISQDERLRVIQRAHERLVEIDKRNAERFGPFLASLSRELDT